jgi:hypothetical protein
MVTLTLSATKKFVQLSSHNYMHAFLKGKYDKFYIQMEGSTCLVPPCNSAGYMLNNSKKAMLLNALF